MVSPATIAVCAVRERLEDRMQKAKVLLPDGPHLISWYSCIPLIDTETI